MLSTITTEATTYNGSCGNNLTWLLDTNRGLLTIKGNGTMSNYSDASDAPWYLYNTYIKEVKIEEGVISIGDYAFYSCKSLKYITIPKSVTSIGENIFFKEAAGFITWYNVTIACYAGSYAWDYRFDSNISIKKVIIKPVVPTNTTTRPTTTPTTKSPLEVQVAKLEAQLNIKQAKVKKLTAKSKSKKKINVKWKKVSKAKGYQVQVSAKKNFKKVIFNKDLKKTKLTIKNKKIKSKKTYYVRVRAYTTYQDVNNKPVKIYSSWSKKTGAKVKVK